MERNSLRYIHDYGCSVFKNDTLGKEFRGFDNAGDSIIYYETLKIGYSIESFSKVNFTLCKDEEKLIQGIKIVRDLLMPQLEKFGTNHKKLFASGYGHIC